MGLRKYLRNCRLANVEQSDFERVVIFTFETWAGEMRLYLELFGGGNAILVDEKGTILQALTYKRMRDRNIIRDQIFRFAPPVGKNPFRVCREDFVECIKGSGDVEIVRVLARSLSIGGFYAEEVLLRTAIDKRTICNELRDPEIHKVFDELQIILSRTVDGKFEPCIILDDDDDFVDVVPFRLKCYADFEHKCYESFNETLDEFYVRVGAIEKALTVATEEVGSLKQEMERLKRIIEMQEEACATAKTNMQENKRMGDIIHVHAGELEALLHRFLAGREEGKAWDEIVSEVLAEKKTGVKSSGFLVSFDDKHLVVDVCLDGLQFGLSLRRSLFDNAARFYRRYKRAKQKLDGAKIAMEESHRKLEEVEARLEKAEAAGSVSPVEVIEEVAERKIERKKWFEKFRWFVSSDGVLVVAGKDAVSNEVLVNKYATDGDIVFHADVVGAPFVVVKMNGEKPSEECLRQAGVFAASFSRGWREGFASVDVYWVKPDQLDKSAKSGQYVPKGGFVVRGKRNWMRGSPLRLAVGIVKEENGKIRFIGGPVESVVARTDTYVVIVPGDLGGKTLLKQILKDLIEKMPKKLQRKDLKVSFEEIREFVPFSKGRIWEG
uniref:FbpA and DUF814 domain protein n=1 Tax=uncultured marine crenarchaeote E48-1C TaxID=907718 RepID=G9BAT4_9ARCH|nr:FbpA and DUF814 domain protein [uncultured marine crenarchaeote E48-1C]